MKKFFWKLFALAVACSVLVLGFVACGEVKHTHNYIETVTAPTCTEQGYTTYTCDCSDTYVDSYVDALGHEFTDYISDNNATYEIDGTKTAVCNRNCGATDTIPEPNTMMESKISFTTLMLNGVTAQATLSNITNEFSFAEEIETTGKSNFVVAKDKYGSQTYLTKIVPLEEGDNVFYIFEMVGEEIKNIYTITLRRRPIYTVSFAGASTQYIEEGFTASVPQEIPQAYGKKFVEWDFDFLTPITEDIYIFAEWFTTIYSIKYDMNGGAMGYTIKGEPVQPTRKVYTYGMSVVLATPTRYGYDFIGWNDGENCITELSATDYGDKTLTAVWECAFTYVIHEENVDTGDRNFYPTKHFGTITGVTDYGKQKKALSVPERIDDVKITKIATNAFYNLAYLQDVCIHGEIEANAFVGCTSLQNVYTHSTTINEDNPNLLSAAIYDYDIFGYRFPNGNYWYNASVVVSDYAYLRHAEFLNIFRTLRQNSPTTSVGALDVKAAIQTHICSDGFKQSVASQEEQKTWTDEDYRKILLADYELALQLFEEELNQDFINATGAFDVFSAPYNEWKEGMNEIFCFFLYEGYITPVYEQHMGKYNKSKIIDFENTELLELYPTKETAIAFAYNDMISMRFDEIISYWGTANNLIKIYEKAFVDVMKKEGCQFRWNDQIVVTQKIIRDYKSVLILERNDNESDEIKNILEKDGHQTLVLNILKDDIPFTWQELSFYDQVILVNIANADMPEGFIDELEYYVNDFGGSLLTVGGNDEYGEANSYNWEDMYGTLYQQMLPVQAINYTPPVGVVFIVDTSGSMTATDNYGTAYFDLVKAGIVAGLDALTARDFVGIVTLSSEATTILPMTARTQESTIHSAINSLEANGGGTVYSSAIQQAGMLLLTCEGLAKYHIIMITDGMPADSAQYPNLIKENYENYGITFSVIGINLYTTSTEYEILQDAVQLGNGRVYNTVARNLPGLLREELSVPEIREVHYEQFSIKIAPEYMDLFDITIENSPTLEGFYGTKLKDGATAILTGIYNVPIYAQWDYGKGTVGCFMCDLNGTWSKTFLQDANGITIIETILYYILQLKTKGGG